MVQPNGDPGEDPLTAARLLAAVCAAYEEGDPEVWDALQHALGLLELLAAEVEQRRLGGC